MRQAVRLLLGGLVKGLHGVAGFRRQRILRRSPPKGAIMSNHFSADNLKFPGDDRRLDLTDVFAFASPEDPAKTVLIIDSNPTSAPPPVQPPATGPEFYPGAIYRINVDTDGDTQADVAFSFTFSEYESGTQTGAAWYATGRP